MCEEFEFIDNALEQLEEHIIKCIEELKEIPIELILEYNEYINKRGE